MRLTATTVLAFMALGLRASAQDVTIGYSQAGANGASYTHQVSAEAFRVTFPSRDVVVRPDDNTVFFINRGQGQYQEARLSKMRDDRTRWNAEISAGRSAPLAPSEATFSSGGSRKKIVGYDVENYVISVEGEGRLEVWMAPQLSRPDHYLSSWTAAQLLSTFGNFAVKATEALEPIQGMPLELHWKTTEGSFAAETTMQATEVTLAALPDSTFRVPTGYGKTASPFDSPKPLPAAQ